MKLELKDCRHNKYKHTPKPGELRLVKDNNMWGYADENGDIVIPGQFHIAHEFYHDLAVVMKNGHFGVIDKEGKTVIPFEYHNITYCGTRGTEDFMIVDKYRKKGLINLKNEIIIPIEYDSIFQYGPNLFRVRLDKKYGLTNDKGEIVTPIVYDSLEIIFRNYECLICQSSTLLSAPYYIS